MLMLRFISTIRKFLILFCSVLTFASCTKPDRSEEAQKLSKEIINEGTTDVEHSLERVDSAEQAGLFTAARANTGEHCQTRQSA